MDYQVFAAAAGIALVDIVLSGDNALVIGAAAGRLPRGQRMFAIIWGGVAALVLRLLFAIAATELLQVPYLRFIGGLTLFLISIRLLLPEGEDPRTRQARDRLLPAILTILAADATMSLDNVLAVGALAAGNITLLVLGLTFSMALLFIASTIVARLIEYFAWLIDVAAIVLAWTSASLVLGDTGVMGRVGLEDQQQTALRFGVVALIILIDLLLRAVRARRQRAHRATTRGMLDTSASPTPDALPPGAGVDAGEPAEPLANGCASHPQHQHDLARGTVADRAGPTVKENDAEGEALSHGRRAE
ncbi:MAG TPA: TerC family protein [Ktedonobacterales bacterium]|jgi:YjbE family integral membrane protein|nr:TerC family protein [Ktedonobacterales bacterium]